MERSPSSSYFEWDEPTEQRQRRSIFGRKSQDGSEPRPIIDTRSKSASESSFKRFALRKRDSLIASSSQGPALQPVYESDFTPPATPSSASRSRYNSVDLLRDPEQDVKTHSLQPNRLPTPSSSYNHSRSQSENSSAQTSSRNSISAAPRFEATSTASLFNAPPRNLSPTKRRSYHAPPSDRSRLRPPNALDSAPGDSPEFITANTPPSQIGVWQAPFSTSTASHYVRTNSSNPAQAPPKSWLRIEETPRTSAEGQGSSRTLSIHATHLVAAADMREIGAVSRRSNHSSARSVYSSSKSTLYSSFEDDNSEISRISCETTRTSVDDNRAAVKTKVRILESPEPAASGQSSQLSTPRLSWDSQARNQNFSYGRPVVLHASDSSVLTNPVDIGTLPTQCVGVPPPPLTQAPSQVHVAKPPLRNFSRPNFSRPTPPSVRRTGVLASVSGSVRGPQGLVRKQASDSSVSTIVPDERHAGRAVRLANPRSAEFQITANAAETVLLIIMSSVANLKDLFATARINKGFYSVYKRHELELMKQVLFNMSPGAWELREASPKEIIAAFENPSSIYTPTRYLQFFTRDTYTLRSLKSLMLTRCKPYMSAESADALRGNADSQRLDDALWRIWTFCTLFGAEKQREDDLVAQMDWLQGGLVVFQPTSALVHDYDDDLARKQSYSSDSFGRGNHGGLSTAQLYDMMEMWNCLEALLAGLQGATRIEQARDNGIFAEQDPDEPELKLLDEWTAYLLTLGLSTILDMATQASDPEATPFVTARDMGWHTWQTTYSGISRRSFLREAIGRIYAVRSGGFDDHNPALAPRHGGYRNITLTNTPKASGRPANISPKSPVVPDDKPMHLWMDYMTRTESQIPVTAPQSTQVNSPPMQHYLPTSARSSMIKSMAGPSASVSPRSILINKGFIPTKSKHLPQSLPSFHTTDTTPVPSLHEKFAGKLPSGGAAASMTASGPASLTTAASSLYQRPAAQSQIISSMPARLYPAVTAPKHQKPIARLPSGISIVRP